MVTYSRKQEFKLILDDLLTIQKFIYNITDPKSVNMPLQNLIDKVQNRIGECEEPELYKEIDGFRFYAIKCEGARFNKDVQGSWGIYCEPSPVKNAGWFFTTYATRSIAEDVIDKLTRDQRHNPFDYMTYRVNFSSDSNPSCTQEQFQKFHAEQAKKQQKEG